MEHGLFRLHFFLRFWQRRHASFLASLAGLWGGRESAEELIVPKKNDECEVEDNQLVEAGFSLLLRLL
jgi:hypothetical protein